MCSAAHGWVGLGRIVYATSSAQLVAWRRAWGLPDGPVAPLSIGQVVPGAVVDGPAPELEAEVKGLHEAFLAR
jgi:tRNA(Arg) A34 adenosine deaminase TadA